MLNTGRNGGDEDRRQNKRFRFNTDPAQSKQKLIGCVLVLDMPSKPLPLFLSWFFCQISKKKYSGEACVVFPLSRIPAFPSALSFPPT